MIINKENYQILDTKEVNLHDDTLSSIFFDRNRKQLKVKCTKASKQHQEYIIYFDNVIGFQISACDFLGASECILDFQSVSHENAILIPNLIEEWQKTPDFIPEPDYDDFIEVLFTLTSGDRLRIACESIEIELI